LNRRIFFQFIFFAFIVAGCNKAATVMPKTIAPPSTQPVTPLVSPPASYLGTYTMTEYGNTLVAPVDLSKAIYGYSDKVSYNRGDIAALYLSGPANKNQKISLYDANGKIVSTVTTPIAIQPITNVKPWVDGCGYNKTIDYQIPANLKSGVYNLTGHFSFVVKDNTTPHDITVVYPSNTNNAYNLGGGKSMYAPTNNISTVASFSRIQYGLHDYYSSFFSWMNLQSYNVNYIADVDLDDYTQIQNSKIVIITGHSEYWTRQARENIDLFIASGKNVLVLSGNTMWWQARYNQPKNLMICYKNNSYDPLNNTLYSAINWTDPLLNYPTTASIGADYNHGGYGNTLPNRWNGYKIVSALSPLFTGTGLKNGDILSVPTREYDCAPVVTMIAPGSTQIPVIDNTKLNCYKVELLGYDFAQNLTQSNKLGLGTFIVYQKTTTSGIVVNAASTNWCSSTGIGGIDKTKIATITKNMIDLSLNNSSLFSF
ncbi:MAG: N,N-dimethylformamidase beta subunit family domain-containing protein, partial [Sphingobacteriales bacterium]